MRAASADVGNSQRAIDVEPGMPSPLASPRRPRPWRRSVVTLVVLSLAAGACGSSSPSSNGPATTDPATTAPASGPTVAGDLVTLAGVHRFAAAPADARQAAAIVQSVGAELFDPLAKALDPTGDGNLVFSPASLAVALAMLRAGASGPTAGQLDRFLHVPATTDLSAAMNGLDQSLIGLAGPRANSQGNDGTVALWSANSLWGQNGVTWEKPFLATLAEQFGTGMRVVDYIHDPDGARQAINQWVSAQTRMKIPELIPAGALDSRSVLTLVNALYFKAPWFTPFTAAARPAPFHRVDGTTVDTRMMELSATIAHARGPNWTAVRLPYAGQKLAMTVIVPDSGAFATVRDQVDQGLLDRLQRTAFTNTPDSNLELPRFSLQTKAPLADLMKALGVTAPWMASHDFDSMSHQLAGRIFVKQIRQQATITVDEQGTEAAAATSVEMQNESAIVDPFTLDVDRPFLFEISDVATGTPLFLGQVTDPTAKG